MFSVPCSLSRARLQSAERIGLRRLSGAVVKRVGPPHARRWVYEVDLSTELLALLRNKRCVVWAVESASELAKATFFPSTATPKEVEEGAALVASMTEAADALERLQCEPRLAGTTVRVCAYFKGGAVVSVRVPCGLTAP